MLVERWTRDQIVVSSSPSRSGGRIFYSPELTFCADFIQSLFHPVLSQLHVKDPGHSAKNAGGRLHLNTHTPLTQQSEWADYAAQT